jgi:hypothetical protein
VIPVTTNITIYVASEAYRQFQKVQSESDGSEAFRPSILTSKPFAFQGQKQNKRPRNERS